MSYSHTEPQPQPLAAQLMDSLYYDLQAMECLREPTPPADTLHGMFARHMQRDIDNDTPEDQATFDKAFNRAMHRELRAKYRAGDGDDLDDTFQIIESIMKIRAKAAQ